MEMLTAKKAFWRIGWALLALAALTIGLQLLLGYLAADWFPGDAPAWLKWALTFLPLYGVALPVSYLILRTVPVSPAVSAPLGLERFLKVLLICFPIMYGGNIIGTVLSLLFSGNQSSNPLMGMALDESPIRLLVIPLLAPLLEELWFRKFLIDRCVRFGEKTAILLSAFCFGLFHMNLYQFFYAFGLGLVFGYVYVRTRRLRYTVILHCFINFLGSVLAPWLLQKSDLLSLAEGAGLAAAGSIDPWSVVVMLYVIKLLAVSVVGLILLVLCWRDRVFRPAEAELAPPGRFRTVCLNPGFLLFVACCACVFVLSLTGF